MLGQGVHVGLDNPFGILHTLDEQAKPTQTTVPTKEATGFEQKVHEKLANYSA